MSGKIDKEFDLIHGMKVTRENMGWLFDLMENQQSELQISKEKEYKFSHEISDDVLSAVRELVRK